MQYTYYDDELDVEADMMSVRSMNMSVELDHGQNKEHGPGWD